VIRRAVIFEDDEVVRSMLWLFFDRRKYEVFTFPYPDLCPLHISLRCPCPIGTICSDIIISDVNMPGRNGIDFVEELISKGCKQRYFALMSGVFTDSDRARASSLGCAVFEKPIDLGMLTAWVEAVEKFTPTERVLFNWTEVG